MRNAKGFTLLEVMLVLLLMGMISAGVVMTLSNNTDSDNSSEWQAQRFSALLQVAEDHALITNSELGIEFDEQQYTFAIYDLKQKKWQPFTNDSITGLVEFPDSIEAEYKLSGSVWDEIEQEENDDFLDEEYLAEIEGDKKQKKINPQVYIMSSGEVTPFTYQFDNIENNTGSSTVKVSMSGGIEIIDEEKS